MDAIIEGEPQQAEGDDQAQRAINAGEDVQDEEINYEGDDEEMNPSGARIVSSMKDESSDAGLTNQEIKENSLKEDNNDGESKDEEAADDIASTRSVSSATTRSVIDDKEHTSYSHPTGDLHRLGLEVITGDDDDSEDNDDVSNHAAYDIVAIHGMHGLSRWTWMTSKPDEPYETWLSDGMKDLPDTHGRVMMYGFDPGDKNGKTWMPTGIYNEAEALLEALMEMRRPEIRLMTQVNLVNVNPNSNQRLETSIFGPFMTWFSIPFEKTRDLDRPHNQVTLRIEETEHELCQVPDKNWLIGDFPNHIHDTLDRLLKQAPPVYPYLKTEPNYTTAFPELESLLKAQGESIIHFRCSPSYPNSTDRVSERARIWLGDKKSAARSLLYFKFDAHDVRFSNASSMLQTFITRMFLAYQKEGEMVVKAHMERLYETETKTMHDLFDEFQFVRYRPEMGDSIIVLGQFDECDESSLWFLSQMREFIEQTERDLRLLIITTQGTTKDESITSALAQFPLGVVTSVTYKPPEPHQYEYKDQVSLMAQELAFISRNDHRDSLMDILSRCKSDISLCEILTTWAQSAEDPFRSGVGMFRDPESVSPGLIFEIILAEVPTTYVSWAQRILVWITTSLRPLRLGELCWISDHSWPSEDKRGKHNILKYESDTLAHAISIVSNFHGLLKVECGEIRFRHPNTRNWLLKKDDDKDTQPWYKQPDAGDRHELVLETCLLYLQSEQETERTEEGDQVTWEDSFPYAVQYWTHHYQYVSGTTKATANDFLNAQPKLARWLNTYRSLPTPLLKPYPTTMTPIEAAAHFNLLETASEILKDTQIDNEILGHAWIEAIRRGNSEIFDLIQKSYLREFTFDDDVLHRAVKVASFCGNVEIFRRVVERIPPSPYPIPKTEREERRKADRADEKPDGEAIDSLGPVVTEEDRDKASEVNVAQEEHSGASDKPEDEPIDPFSWLDVPLIEACMLGLDDVISTLLSVGADPCPPKDTHLHDKTPLDRAVTYGHIEAVKVLLDAGADVNRVNSYGCMPWCMGRSAAITTLLLKSGAAMNTKTKFPYRPIEWITERGDFLSLEALLKYGDYKKYYEEGPENHPVNIAAENGRAKCLEILLRYGFDPNMPRDKGNTSLWHTIDIQRIDMCRALLENGADPDLAPDGSVTPLYKAVWEEREDIMDLLLEYKADINKREPPGSGWSRTPLQAAIDWKDEPRIEYLIDHGAETNLKDSDSIYAVYSAAQSGLTAIVQKLVEAKADVNSASGSDGWTSAHTAYKYPETVAALIELGADLNITTVSGYTPLDVALDKGYPETVQIILEKSKIKFDFSLPGTQKALIGAVADSFVESVSAMLEAGADVNTIEVDNDENKNQPLTAIAMRSGDDAMLRKLMEFRPDLNLVSDEQNTALHCISDVTPVSSVRLFVNAGGKLDVLNKNRQSPLQIAAEAGNEDVFKYILKKAAARSVLHVAPREGMGTVMHIACESRRLEMVQLLMEQKMDINHACDGLWGTPLLSAVMGRSGNIEDQVKRDIVELLLKEGADLNKAGGIFGFPINAACLGDSTESVEYIKLLLERGASVDVKDPMGRKPVHMACYNSLEAFSALEIPDSDFVSRDVVGRVPLHYAVSSGQTDLVEEVIARSARVGVDINVKDNDGWTPLLWAARSSHALRSPNQDDALTTDVVTLLIEKGADLENRVPAFSSQAPQSVSQIAYYHNADESRSSFHKHHQFRDEGDEWDDMGELEEKTVETEDQTQPEVDGENGTENGSEEGFDEEIVG
ncbi:hypothetical protein FGRMN_2368 [Fusarium graminum]|nr:hypothetical protein FGRMN_2368 [Fusarium graminum]